jgi:diguanylate cyclase (GGDEF)-like protein
MTGWSVGDWVHQSFGDLFANPNGPPTPIHLNDWLPKAGEIGNQRLRMADHKGGWSWVDVSGRRLNDGKEEQNGYTFLLTLRSADEQELQDRRLRRLASVDQLTRLLNRNTVLQQLEARIGAGRGNAEALALLYVDCDGFKGINDCYSHAAGDAVLRTIADRISHQIRHGDLAARLGGDEFLVVLNGIRDVNDALRVAEKLVNNVQEPILWNDQSLSLSISVGVALHASGEDTELLLRRADHAMYAAKASGRNRVALS